MLEISLFGRPRIRHMPDIPHTSLTGILGDLFAYLVLHRDRTFERDALAGMFWGECDERRAHGNLNSTLWRLRQILEPASPAKGKYLLTARSGEVGFNPDGEFWLDAATFEQRVSPVLGKPASDIRPVDVITLHDALGLYHSDLIESCTHDWALFERERLRNLFLQTLAVLMRHHGMQGEYAQSVRLGQQILRHDPCREEVHRYLMQLFVRMGQRQFAMRQYERCRAVLSDELGVAPMEETQILVAHILGSEQSTPEQGNERGSVDACTSPPGDSSINQQLAQACQMLSEAKRQLQAAEQILEGIQAVLADAISIQATRDNAVIAR